MMIQIVLMRCKGGKVQCLDDICSLSK